MTQSLLSCIGVKVNQLKVMCGISTNSSALEERAVEAVGRDPIPAGVFLAVYKQKLQGKQLATELRALSRNEDHHPTNAALRNGMMNNKQEVVTFDHSRVIVWDRPGWLTTDYYNASFVDGYNGPKEYLVSQGPNTKCIVSFWHMVWQEGVTCIVMATGLFENAVQQCDKYWVDKANKHVQHGYIHIWHEGSTYLAQLNIRTFRIQKEGTCESRLLTHYEMVGFHDESPDPGLLLDVRRRVSSLSITQPGPILVHCRCGGGRTAVYVAVDYCLHQLHSEDRVDVYSTVLHLRRFRKNMIRTLAQYQQIYQAVAMYLQCGTTVYPAHTLVAAYQVHYSSDAKAFKLEREFQTLQIIVPRLSIGDCASGHRVENRSKSRDIMMLPPECARPYLSTSDCGDSGTDFINAVYIDGYHAENMYLATQWPMKKTIADFWRMLYDLKISSLVLMNDMHKFTRNYLRFWPKEVDHSAKYGAINVRYLSCDKLNHVTIRTFAIRKVVNNLVGCEIRQDEIIVKMFQVLGPRGNNSSGKGGSSQIAGRGGVDPVAKGQSGRGVGIMSKSLLTVMEHASDWQRRANSRQPVCVMSKDGCSHVGLYCAINVCCDQVKTEREVDVFNAVRLIRKHRPQLVPNLEEYRYIYHFMSEYILLTAAKSEIFECAEVLMSQSNSLQQVPASAMSVSNSLHGGVYIYDATKHGYVRKDSVKASPGSGGHAHPETGSGHLKNLQSPPTINVTQTFNCSSIHGLPTKGAIPAVNDLSTSSHQPACGMHQPTSSVQPPCQHQPPSLSTLHKPSISFDSVPFTQQPSHLSSSFSSYSMPSRSLTSSHSSNYFITSDISGNGRLQSQLKPCSINITPSSSFNSCLSSVSPHKTTEMELGGQYSLHNGRMPSSDLIQTIMHHSSPIEGTHKPGANQNQTPDRNVSSQHSASVRFNETGVGCGELPADIKLIHASYVSLEESSSSSDGDNYRGSMECISQEVKHKHFNGVRKKNVSVYHSHHQNGEKRKDPGLELTSSLVTAKKSSSSTLKQRIKNYLAKCKTNKENIASNLRR